jgi:bile acid-coenzyme A ligase
LRGFASDPIQEEVGLHALQTAPEKVSKAMAKMISVGRKIGELATAAPDLPMLSCGPRTVTRREFEEQTNQLARALHAAGVRKGDTLAIALPNGMEVVHAIFAGLKIGATLLPISPKLPSIERHAILELARPALVIGVPAEAALPFPVLDQTELLDPSHHSSEPLEEDAISEPSRGIMSGGSTGRPKIILMRDAGVIDPSSPPGMRIEPGETVLIPGPLYHGMPFAYTYRTLLSGGHVVLLERFDATECLAAVNRYEVQILAVVPTMMNRIWDLGEATRNSFNLGSLRMIVHSASSCPAWLKERWIDWLGPERIHEFYGSAERIGFTWITGTEWLAHKGSVGRAYDSKIRIIGEDGRDLPHGEVGEIFMRHNLGVGSTYRYIGADPLRQHDGFETVGDMGWLDEEGYLFIADRRVDMIVSGGANVFPAEVEAALERHPLINDCAVIGLPDADLVNRVHAIIHATGQTDAKDLRNWLRDYLAAYKIPRSFEFVNEPLRDEAGKLRRAQLRKSRLESNPPVDTLV